MHSFCAEDILRWSQQHGNDNTCPMCRQALGELRPANYNPDLALTILLRDGLTDLPWIVGQDALFKMPLSERLVSHKYLHVTEVCTEYTRYHQAQIGARHLGNAHVCLDSGCKDLEADRYARTLAWDAALQIMQYWRDERGVRLLQELQFPEVDTQARIFMPVEPEIVVFNHLEELRSITDNCRLEFERLGINPPPGWWLKRALDSRQLLSMHSLRNDNKTEVVRRAENDHEVRWVLWQPNSPNETTLYAVPRFPVSTGAARYGGNLVWAFNDAGGEPIQSVSAQENKAANSDPELYDFRTCFSDQYEGEDGEDTIIDSPSNLRVPSEREGSLGNMWQNLERIRHAREVLMRDEDVAGPLESYSYGILGSEDRLDLNVNADGTIYELHYYNEDSEEGDEDDDDDPEDVLYEEGEEGNGPSDDGP
jgi:hypothetical protein